MAGSAEQLGGMGKQKASEGQLKLPRMALIASTVDEPPKLEPTHSPWPYIYPCAWAWTVAGSSEKNAYRSMPIV